MRTHGASCRPLRVLIVDYAGHPFQYQLAKELAQRGFQVDHTHCASTVSPKADFTTSPDVVSHPIKLRRPFAKYAPWRRLLDEVRYGWKTAKVARQVGPDRMLTSNVPVVSLFMLWAWSVVTRTPWILWLQDLQSGLVSLVAGEQSWTSRLVRALEGFLLRRAPKVIVISPELGSGIERMGVAADRIALIENWAPIEQLPVRSKDNAWARRHHLAGRFVFLYSGTLGRKHSPELLLTLVDEFADDDDVEIVVVAEGVGADWLADQQNRRRARNLILLPFQAFEMLPDVLATADVLIALLDGDAAGFSVPSKTTSYLCAGRPVLAAVPPDNGAARLIRDRAGAGITVAPHDERAFRVAARSLRDDDRTRAQYGRRARAYAEATFSSTAITDQFEVVMAIRSPDPSTSPVG